MLVDEKTSINVSVGIKSLAVKFVICIEVALGLISGAELRQNAKTRHQVTELSAAASLLMKDIDDACGAPIGTATYGLTT